MLPIRNALKLAQSVGDARLLYSMRSRRASAVGKVLATLILAFACSPSPQPRADSQRPRADSTGVPNASVHADTLFSDAPHSDSGSAQHVPPIPVLVGVRTAMNAGYE